VRLVERRIGLLFAIFLALLCIAALRATWLGTVKAGALKERALTQQEQDLTVHARRGTIMDRRGLELAVSEEAFDVYANPFLIKDPAGVARKLAPLLQMNENELLRTLSTDKGFVYLMR
jgi:cell division protein FtsI/penicillin-binding protein 2